MSRQGNGISGHTVLLEHTGMVKSVKCDFQQGTYVHTLIDWELSDPSTFHRVPKEEWTSFFP